MLEFDIQFFGGRGSGGGKRTGGGSKAKASGQVTLHKSFNENSPETIHALEIANEAYYNPDSKTLNLFVNEAAFYKTLDVSDWSEKSISNLHFSFPNIVRIHNTKGGYIYKAAGTTF